MKAEIIIPPPQREIHFWMKEDEAKTLLRLIGATSKSDRIRMWGLIDKTISVDDTEVLSRLWVAIREAGVESE